MYSLFTNHESYLLSSKVLGPALLIAICAYLFQTEWLHGRICPATTQYLREAPYDNYFYSDCNVDAQVVVTSPLPDSNLTIIGPRLIVAWPAGNSGICIVFRPSTGPNGTLGLELVNSTIGNPLSSVYHSNNSSKYPYVGVQGVLSFNNSAQLIVPILGSIRTIRDFTEGPSLLNAAIQNANRITRFANNGVSISRPWLDNATISTFTLEPYRNSQPSIQVEGQNVTFASGHYRFTATINYPQLIQLPPSSLLNNASKRLLSEQAEEIRSLTFLSYTEKLLAGGWRFLTYFGRDSMISALLLEPVLNSGEGSAIEAVIISVLERTDHRDGSVCHEETIGDYATFLNLQNNIASTAAVFTYQMVDTDFYLPILMQRYFEAFPERAEPLLSRVAGSANVANQDLIYRELALRNAEKIMNIAAAFQRDPSIRSLISLKPNEVVGQWRDSIYGIGGGRIPFDVNTALVPAALRAIAQLSRLGNVYCSNSSSANYGVWSKVADARATIWENSILQFFENNITLRQTRDRLDSFVGTNSFYSGSTQYGSFANTTVASGADLNEDITTYAVALNGNDNLSSVNVLHTDTAFRLFFLNTTTNAPAQLAQEMRFLNSTANSILRPFPAGLLTPVGLVVANPALSGSNVLIQNFTNSAYHGTVVWSWQLALMAKGLERQIVRCINERAPLVSHPPNSTTNTGIPAWCDTSVLPTLKRAYNTLWDVIEVNKAQLASEVWSWTYNNDTGYTSTAFGSLPPPPGVSAGTESNIRQLWSLTFLAVRRNTDLR